MIKKLEKGHWYKRDGLYAETVIWHVKEDTEVSVACQLDWTEIETPTLVEVKQKRDLHTAKAGDRCKNERGTVYAVNYVGGELCGAAYT